MYDQSYVLSKLRSIFEQSAEQEEVRAFSKDLFKKVNDKYSTLIKEKEDVRNPNEMRDIQTKLKKWRLKDRKIEF